MEAEIADLEQRNQYAVRYLQATEQALEREKTFNEELNKVLKVNLRALTLSWISNCSLTRIVFPSLKTK